MKSIETKYGELYGISRSEFYDNESIKECLLNEENILNTPFGKLIPRYEQENVRDKYTKSISFYKNGNLKSIAMQKPCLVNTEYGAFEAELLTFYETGQIKRLFPLNGKLTGYWEEEQEKSLAKALSFKLGEVNVDHKCISLYFYQSGKIKSITLWQDELLQVEILDGLLLSRIGAKFYESGELYGVEPAYPTLVTTRIGSIFAYDPLAIGIHSDNPSLVFEKDLKVKELKTGTDYIEIIGKNKVHIIYKPRLVPNMMNPDEFDTVPVIVTFDENRIMFNHSKDHVYNIEEIKIKIEHKVHQIIGGCSSCSSCGESCSE